MKLITAIAALALVAGSVSLVQPVLAKVQNVDEPSRCVAAGFPVTVPVATYPNLQLVDCDSHFVNPYLSYDDSEGVEDIPPFEWVYDPETQYIRTLTKPYYQTTNQMLGEVQWVQRPHRCFSTNVGDMDPEDWNPLPWKVSSTRFNSTYCSYDPNEWLYDSDTHLLSLDAFPDWCLTMSPSPTFPSAPGRFLFLAKCGDPTEHWAELEAGNIPGPYPTVYSQEWWIPVVGVEMEPPPWEQAEDEEEELVEEEEIAEVGEEEIAEVGEEELVEEEVAEFIAELVSVYGAQDTESFESLVSEEYREVRTSDEDEEHLDYDALMDAVRDEAHLANAFQITHSILGVRSGKNGVRVRLQWGMRFEDAQSGERKSRKGVTGLGLAHFEGWQLITQRGKPLFGAITSESLKGTEKRSRRNRPTRPGRGRN